MPNKTETRKKTEVKQVNSTDLDRSMNESSGRESGPLSDISFIYMISRNKILFSVTGWPTWTEAKVILWCPFLLKF